MQAFWFLLPGLAARLAARCSANSYVFNDSGILAATTTAFKRGIALAPLVAGFGHHINKADWFVRHFCFSNARFSTRRYGSTAARTLPRAPSCRYPDRTCAAFSAQRGTHGKATRATARAARAISAPAATPSLVTTRVSGLPSPPFISLPSLRGPAL